MKRTRPLAVAALTAALVAAPAFAFADTATTTATSTDSTATTTVVQSNSADLTAQINALIAEINALKAQIASLAQSAISGSSSSSTWTASTTPSLGCPVPSRDLGEGDSGDDVRQVQQFLASTSPSVFPSSDVTGFFGPVTAHAVQRFQEDHSIASTATGFVGPLTRAFLGNHCGEIEGEGHLNGTANQNSEAEQSLMNQNSGGDNSGGDNNKNKGSDN